MTETTLQRAKILQRYHKIVRLLFVGAFAIMVFSAQYVLMREIDITKMDAWWLPDVMDLVGIIFLSVSYGGGMGDRRKFGEVSFERHLKAPSLRIDDVRLQGEWSIWREETSVNYQVIAPIFLILGAVIVIMALLTWKKNMLIQGDFQSYQKAETIQQFMAGCVFIWVGFRSWSNRMYTYRLYVRQGKTTLILGIRALTVLGSTLGK